MNKTLSIIALLIVLGVGGYFAYNNYSPNPSKDTNETAEDQTIDAGQKVLAPNPDAKEFVVGGVPFSFNPSEIKVKKGDTVRITFVSQTGFHDFVIDEFNVRTKQLNAGEQEMFEFVADKAGTFEYYCSVGNHRAMGMVGKLIVE